MFRSGAVRVADEGRVRSGGGAAMTGSVPKPRRRLAYLWHLRFDRADATEVEVTFAATGSGTAVSIVHRGWERLGAKGPERRERNRKGWAGVTEHYRRVCDEAS